MAAGIKRLTHLFPLLLLVGLATTSTLADNVASLVLLNEAAVQDGAVYLDGSPGAVYFKRNAEANKFVIIQKGGGWCISDVDCAARAGSFPLGSSKEYPMTLDLDAASPMQGGDPFLELSSNATVNPYMYNYSFIFIPYGDGMSQLGNLDDPVKVGNKTIYYRGYRVLKAIQNFLMFGKLNSSSPATKGIMADATDCVISGGSAGGLSTFLHSDSWKSILPPTANVVSFPDSGFFLDYSSTTYPSRPSYHDQLTWVYTAGNASGSVPQACVQANPSDPSKCVFAEHVAPTLVTPFFPMQSCYDSWQIGNELYPVPGDNATEINAYGNLLYTTLMTNLINVPNSVHGVFLDSCYHHTREWGQIIIDGVDQATAFQQWRSTLPAATGSSSKSSSSSRRGKSVQVKRTWIQGQAYPCTACCNGGQ